MPHKLAIMPANRSRQSVIDEYGELCRRIEQFAPVAARHKELKEEIRSWYDEHPADQTAIAEGRQYTIHVGMREWQRKIRDMDALSKLIGIRKFLQFCSFPIAQVDALVTEAKMGLVLTKAQSGLRSVKAVQKAARAVES